MRISVSSDYKKTNIKVPQKLYQGLDARVYSLAGKWKGDEHSLRDILDEAERIDKLSLEYKKLTHSELQNKCLELKSIFRRRKKGYEEGISEALAVLQEASSRVLGMRPYVVQLAGALALYKGYIAEMATGEGKTLTAALAGVIHGWIGLPFHIITVNDYLAARDAKTLKPLYDFCYLSVGAVTSELPQSERKKAYNKEIAYTTSKEIVADFLRDRLWLGKLQQSERRLIAKMLGREGEIERGTVMRGIHTAIVDEADSVLIDEAVTPLIISKTGENEQFVKACKSAGYIADKLVKDKDYLVNEKYKEIQFTEEMREAVIHKSSEIKGLFSGSIRRLELIKQALNAREFFKRDKQYVIKDGKIVIVDEFTGRLMPQRTWRAGLHQFIEAKEDLEITHPSETLARLSFQRFFRFFKNLAGMTGTGKEAGSEFWHIYQIPVLRIPENKECKRQLSPLQVFSDRKSKWESILKEIIEVHESGRPILVGTRNIHESEYLGKLLEEKGYAFRILNAVRHQEEARVIANAGEKNTITVATNMAGRGTDIKLGMGVEKLGGLHVIATECHESARIDRQLFGRSSRQGDPGSASSFISMDDELIVRYLPQFVRNNVKKIMERNISIGNFIAKKAVKLSQYQAQNIAYKQRCSVLKMDTWVEDSLSFTEAEISS